jgi:hypothetical protein
MTAARLRLVSTWTTAALVALIVVLTLFVSPAEGDLLSRIVPGTVPLIGDDRGYDTCIGGIDCQDGHALAFIALGTSLGVQVLAGRRGRGALVRAVAVLLLLGVFAAVDELAQGWTGRDASFDDWLADASGALLGLVLGSEIARYLAQDPPER